MTTSPPSGSEPPPPSSAFERLHPRVQRWIWERGWTELRDAQEAAVEPILAGDRDVIIAAATASGKTEAAFLPICSALAADGDPQREGGGVRVLYVSPLKALINDQFDRLDQLCERLEVPVHRWHGDVTGSRKARLLRDPDGVLLITPESLEALFVLRGSRVPALLGGLAYIVVDELHSFVGTERGAQLQSLLRRVELALRRRVPRIGLSATLGDMRAAAAFLRPEEPDGVALLASDDDGQELRLQVRGYRSSPPRLTEEQAEAAVAAGEAVSMEDVTPGDVLEIGGHLFETLRGTDNLIFANARRQVEIYADLLATLSERHKVPNEFWPHHGSLSKGLREHVEARLKERSRPVNVVCTSTLEMGIDIGTMASIAQVGAPPSVSGMRQRLGRSGRRGGAAVLRVYVAQEPLGRNSPPPEALRAELVQAIAAVRLLLERWYEPPEAGELHLSTLVQQVLSLIAQHGGVRPAEAYGALCGPGPFAAVSRQAFAALLRRMGGEGLLLQVGDGLLLPAPKGERLLNHYSFYTAFTTPEEYRLVTEGRVLGTIPIEHPLSEGSLLVFAGRRWRVLSVEGEQKIVHLAASPGGLPPKFGGAELPVHDRVRAEMRAVYEGEDVPPYLDAVARELLDEARESYRGYRLDERALVGWGGDAYLFPWRGDRVLGTLGVALSARGLSVTKAGPALVVAHATTAQLRAHLAALLAEGPPDPSALAAGVGNKQVEKYDWVLEGGLLDAAYAARSLDPEGAWEALRELLARTPSDPSRGHLRLVR